MKQTADAAWKKRMRDLLEEHDIDHRAIRTLVEELHDDELPPRSLRAVLRDAVVALCGSPGRVAEAKLNYRDWHAAIVNLTAQLDDDEWHEANLSSDFRDEFLEVFENKGKGGSALPIKPKAKGAKR